MGFGVGVVLAISLVSAIYIWWENRPTPPKPWNQSVITARFATLTFQVHGEELHARYVYGFKNNGQVDYEVPLYPSGQLAAKLPKNEGTSVLSKAEWDGVKIPVGQELNVEFTVKYRIRDFAHAEEILAGKEDLYVEFIKRRVRDIQSFEFFDYDNRYKVSLPPVPEPKDAK